jgi:hypothetical protein
VQFAPEPLAKQTINCFGWGTSADSPHLPDGKKPVQAIHRNGQALGHARLNHSRHGPLLRLRGLACELGIFDGSCCGARNLPVLVVERQRCPGVSGRWAPSYPRSRSRTSALWALRFRLNPNAHVWRYGVFRFACTTPAETGSAGETGPVAALFWPARSLPERRNAVHETLTLSAALRWQDTTRRFGPLMSKPDRHLAARSEAKLAQNVFDVHLNGALANHQAPGDFPIAQSARHQAGDFSLASSEPIGSR